MSIIIKRNHGQRIYFWFRFKATTHSSELDRYGGYTPILYNFSVCVVPINYLNKKLRDFRGVVTFCQETYSGYNWGAQSTEVRDWGPPLIHDTSAHCVVDTHIPWKKQVYNYGVMGVRKQMNGEWVKKQMLLTENMYSSTMLFILRSPSLLTVHRRKCRRLLSDRLHFIAFNMWEEMTVFILIHSFAIIEKRTGTLNSPYQPIEFMLALLILAHTLAVVLQNKC